MSTEVKRRVVGVSGRGEVTVIEFDDPYLDNMGNVRSRKRHVVRNGPLTVGEFSSPVEANTVAKALVG